MNQKGLVGMRAVLVMLFCLLLPLLRPQGLYVTAAFLLAVPLAALLFRLPINRSASWLLFFCVPWVSVFGSGSLLALALLSLFLLCGRISWSSLRWALPLLSVLAAWSVSDLIWGIELPLVRQVLDEHGAGSFRYPGLLAWLRADPPAYLLSLAAFTRFAVLAILFTVLQAMPEIRLSALHGLVAGSLAGVIVSALQISGMSLSGFANTNSYWEMVQRSSGSFSDPNAFGVFAALALPLLFIEARSASSRSCRSVAAVALVLWLIAAPFSGSRSFFAALLVYAAFFWARRSPRSLGWAGGLALMSLIAVNAAASLWPELAGTAIARAPIGIARLADSLIIGNASQTFFSRLVFFKIAVAAWLQDPILGVGFNHFRMAVPPLAGALGIPIGNWADNANNFYLGLLAETGLAGMAGFLWALAGIGWRKGIGEQWPAKAGVLCLAVLLVFGPHIEFDEIALLAALLLAQALIIKEVSPSVARPALVAVAVAVIVISNYFSERGFYLWERSEQGRFYRWTRGRASGYARCNKKGKARLLFAVLNPDLEAKPLDVALQVEGGPVQTAAYSRAGERRQELDCLPGRSQVRYVLEASRVWSPAVFGLSGDRRHLGVQVFEENIARKAVIGYHN